MLNDQELEEYFNRHELDATAREVIRNIRNSEPSRRVKSGKCNVACRYASRKMGLTIQAESHKNELAALIEWDFDDATHEVYDQPPKIKMQYRNKNGRQVSYMYTPDYFLLQEDFAGWVECKAEEWLQARAAEGSSLYVRDKDNKWKCPAGEKYAAEVGLKFIVRSSAENNWKKVRNIEFLADYLDERCLPVKEAVTASIYEAMDNQAWVTLKRLIDVGCEPDAIFKMIADGKLHVDLDMHLLVEPEHAIVFRDATAAQVYCIHQESKQLPVVGKVRPIKIAPDQSFIWDGQLWRILNVGEDDVFMEDANHVMVRIPKGELTKLAKQGVITGLPEGANVTEHAEEVFRKTSPTDFKYALNRYKCIFPEESVKSVNTVTVRTLRKWRSRFRKSEQAFGTGFLGLLPRIHRRGNRNRKIDGAVLKIMNNVIDEWYAQPDGKSKLVCWGEVRNRCVEIGLTPPSEKAFRFEIKLRHDNELKEAREGEKAAYSDSEFIWWLEATTPRHGDRPFEIGHIDHTELDLQFVCSRTGKNLNKAWLTVMLDANTRKPLAWVILYESPSHRSCMSVIRECVKRHGRIPKYIVVDKGSDFESEYFECLLARLGSHKKTRPGGKPRFGSVIERFFGVTNEIFIHNLRGNNTALQKPRQMSASHDPKKLAVWTLPAFKDAFDDYQENLYSNLEHGALGMTPNEAMAIGMKQAGVRQHMLIPYTDDFTTMCMPGTKKGTAKIEAGRGVKINYLYYWTPEFRDPRHAGKDVPARYDPIDGSRAFVWLKDHWALCQSELAADFKGRSVKEIYTATQELRARQKRTGTRRAINAQMIAAYFKEVMATEEGLLNRLRQEEMQIAQGQSATQQGIDQQQEAPPVNEWDDINLKVFGEF